LGYVYTETILKIKRKSGVVTFYSAFRRAFWVGNPRAYDDAKVCGISYALQVARSA